MRLTLLAGDAEAARTLARGARARFARRGAEIAHARARSALSLAAAVALATVRPSELAETRRAAATLAGDGWHQEAIRARLTVARAALALGWYGEADTELDRDPGVATARAGRRPVEWWHVTALARLARGDRAGALRAARAGFGLLDRHRASLGASELRVTASAIGIELARLGLRAQLGADDTDAVLGWSERLRAKALELDPVTPPDSPELRDSRSELREVSARLRRRARRRRGPGAARAPAAAGSDDPPALAPRGRR